MIEQQEARLAGSDTREALAANAVRAAAAGAAFVAGPGWAAVFATPHALSGTIAIPRAVGPWVALAVAASGIAAAILAWRFARDPTEEINIPEGTQRRLPSGFGSAAAIAFGALIVALTNDDGIAALFLPCVAVLAGWATGCAARVASTACVPQIRSAAGGLVTAGAVTGLLVAGHLGLVAKGSGLRRVAGWTIAYALLACINFVRAARALPEDRSRIAARLESDAAHHAPATGREHAAQAPALLLDSITVSFGPTTVLRGADLAVTPGELVALVGGNGAGKSTMLRAAAGFITPDAGRVVVAGDDVTTLLPEHRVTAGLAFVSGARPVFPDLTVVQNLRVAAYQTHATARAFASATDAVLGLVPALAARRRAKAGVLSGGEQRLLAVAQSLYRRPAVLLADELSLGLDLEARLAVLDLLRLLADEGVAVVCVDHDLPTLLPRADRAALLAGGRVTMHAEPAALLERRSDLLPATFLAGAAR